MWKYSVRILAVVEIVTFVATAALAVGLGQDMMAEANSVWTGMLSGELLLPLPMAGGSSH